MAICVPAISAALICLGAAIAFGQETKPPTGPPTIVQPGAPGQAGKTLTPATARARPHTLADADVSFMQGMIMHHSQAVEMVALLKTRGASKDLQALGDRITISQSDEIRFMKKWLEDRGKPTTMGQDMSHMDMKGMDMKGMNMKMDMPLMPGMLSPAQMDALAKAKGAAFDHLFLTGMIQHHTGALTMVQELFETPGAGQDAVLFDFATDIDNTQRAEIKIMQGMLEKK